MLTEKANEIALLSGWDVGIEFEFYTQLSTPDAAKSLSRILKKKVVPLTKYHSDMVPTQTEFKLEPDFSGGPYMRELVTGPLPWFEAKSVLIAVCNWVNTWGYTDDRCALQFNYSPNKSRAIGNTDMQTLDTLQMIFEIDEEKLLEKFPNRKGSIYARSIVEVFPRTGLLYNTKNPSKNKQDWKLPNLKYYGLNFTKLEKGYLEVRYWGGKDWQKKWIDAWDGFINIVTETSRVLNGGKWTPSADNRFKNWNLRLNEVSDKLKSFDLFKLNFKNIKLTANLSEEHSVVEAYWPLMRETLIKEIFVNGLYSGEINWDSDVRKFQFRECKWKRNGYHEDMEFFHCENLSGMFTKCDIHGTELQKSHLYECKIYDCEIKTSKVMDCVIETHSEIESSYIDIDKRPLRASIKDSIIRSGIKIESTEVDDKTLWIKK